MTKRTISTAILTLTLGAAAAFAQAPIERQAPAGTPQQQQDPNAPQQPPMHAHHPHNPHKQAMMMARRLNLTPDQTAKVEPILASRDEQVRNLMGNTQLTPDQRHHEMHQIMKGTQQQLAGVLTPDQMQQLRTMRREHKMQEQQQQGQQPQG